MGERKGLSPETRLILIQMDGFKKWAAEKFKEQKDALECKCNNCPTALITKTKIKIAFDRISYNRIFITGIVGLLGWILYELYKIKKG